MTRIVRCAVQGQKDLFLQGTFRSVKVIQSYFLFLNPDQPRWYSGRDADMQILKGSFCMKLVWWSIFSVWIDCHWWKKLDIFLMKQTELWPL